MEVYGLWLQVMETGRLSTDCLALGQVMNGIFNVLSKIGIENIGVCIIIFTIIIYTLMIPLTINAAEVF